MNLAEYRERILRLPYEDGPYLTMSLDLSPARDGQPVALTMLKKAMAGALEDAGADWRSRAPLLADHLGAAVDDAVTAGALGLHTVWSPHGSIELQAPFAFRNHLRLADVPWLFEMERQAYLLRRGLLAVHVSRSDVRIVRIESAAIGESQIVERNVRDTYKVHGRTSIEGRSGAPDATGGHSFNRRERVVEEKRAAEARTAARAVESIWRPGDLLVIAGAQESTAELLNHLNHEIAAARIEPPAAAALPEESRELLELATALSTESQLSDGDALATEILSGAAGERIARGRAAVESALAAERLGVLVLHEDVVAHWGSAIDARRHQPGWSDDPYEQILRAALGQGAEVRFSRLDDLLDRYEGVAASTRW